MRLADKLTAAMARVDGLRSIENPAQSLGSPDHWLLDYGSASSGVAVNGRTALTYSPVWRAIDLISGDLAKLPLVVYERDKKDGKERDTKHAAYKLLKYRANAYMSAFVFKQTIQWQACLKGNGYAYISRNGAAAPSELLPLDSDDTYPVRENGKLWYVTKVGNEQRKLKAEDVLHIRGLGDGLMGMSLIEKARESLGLGIASQKYASIFFRNGARPGVVLRHPNTLSPEAAGRLKESWEKMHSGLEQSHRVAVLEEGMEAHEFKLNAKDAQVLETRQFSVREVANWFGVPPHKLGDDARVSYNSLEQENQSYLDEALDKWLCNWESECREKLLTGPQKTRDTHVIEFTRQALLRADMSTRGVFYQTATGGRPWMTVNEVRSRENMNSVDEGDDITPPTNNFEPQGGGDGQDQGGGEGDTDSGQDVDIDNEGENAVKLAEAQKRMLADTIRRMATLLGNRVARQRKSGRDIAPDAHTGQLVDALRPPLESVACVYGKEINTAGIAERMIEDYMRVADEVSDGDALKLLNKDFAETYPQVLAGEIMAGVTAELN